MTNEPIHYTITITAHETHVSPSSGSLRIRNAAGDSLEPSSSNYHATIFDHVFSEGDLLLKFERVRKTVRYELAHGVNPRLKKRIDTETFKKLPEKVHSLYRPIKVDDTYYEPIEEDQITVFDVADYAEKNPEVYVLTQEEAIQSLINLNFKGVNKRARVRHVGFFLRNTEKLAVDFYATDYNGETKKRLDTKKNGQPYADRRGKIVADYPKVVSEVEILTRLVPDFYGNTKEELNEKLQAYFDHITQTAKLPK